MLRSPRSYLGAARAHAPALVPAVAAQEHLMVTPTSPLSCGFQPAHFNLWAEAGLCMHPGSPTACPARAGPLRPSAHLLPLPPRVAAAPFAWSYASHADAALPVAARVRRRATAAGTGDLRVHSVGQRCRGAAAAARGARIRAAEVHAVLVPHCAMPPEQWPRIRSAWAPLSSATRVFACTTHTHGRHVCKTCRPSCARTGSARAQDGLVAMQSPRFSDGKAAGSGCGHTRWCDRLQWRAVSEAFARVALGNASAVFSHGDAGSLARRPLVIAYGDPSLFGTFCASAAPLGPALPCPALPCPALPCPALPCPALPCNGMVVCRLAACLDSARVCRSACVRGWLRWLRCTCAIALVWVSEPVRCVPVCVRAHTARLSRDTRLCSPQ